MKKKTWLFAALMAATMLGAAGCGGKKNDNSGSNGGGKDTEAPVITVNGVPTSCNVGDTVTLPAATATDNVDGDVSSKVKVTVSQLKADGETVNREIIYEKAGNVEQSFDVTSNTLLAYKIIYTCKDAAGNKGENSYALLAVADNETGTLVINETSVDGFSVENGISGVAGADVKLPSATAIDQPGDVNISNLVTAKLYEKKGGETATTLFASWQDFSEVKNVRIPAGNYELVYGVKDAAGNEFETMVKIPVTIAQPEETNHAYDKNNFAFDNDQGYEETGKEGMSWINEFGELAFGNTSAEANLDQTVGFTSKLTKVHEQYVGIAFNADPPTTNGQTFYTVSARGSKNRDTMPNKETCTWPDYLFLRIGKGRIESRIERASDKEMTTIKGYEQGLLDGKDHVLYLQWKNIGEDSTAAGAAIRLYGWVDKIPGGADNADFIFEAKAGDKIDQGTLTQEIFTELWNESTGAGWFTMDTYSGSKPHDDDHMRLKGLIIYDANETEFSADILPPSVSVEFTTQSVYATTEAIAIPSATVDGADEVKTYIIDAKGNKTEITGDSYTPADAGVYTLVYEAYDAANNYGYKAFKLNVAVRDSEAPTLTISSEETITVNVGDKVTLPTATATDNLDGDVSANVKVEIIGTEHVTDRVAGGDYYPMTAGTQKVIYSIADAFGNTATKEMTIVVNSVTNGNLLDKELVSSGNGVGLANKEYIYDQKVSTIINIEEQKSVIQFNARGPVKNNDWPNGIVIRITDTNLIDVSAAWHDHCIYGSTSYSKQKYWKGQDILFEYQTKNVVIEGVEYIRVQIWVQGEELVFNADGSKGGLVGLEEGVNALYRKVEDFVDEQVENVYSSPFWVAAYNSTITVKEVRIDGTSCTKPADPVVPDGYEINFGSGNFFIEESVTVAGGGDASQVLGKHSNEDYIAVTFNGEETGKGAFCLNVTGVAEGWGGGLVIRISQDGFELRAGGPNAAHLASMNANPFSGGIKATSYTVVYKLGYIKNQGVASAVTVDVWFGEAGGALTKLVPTVASADLCAYDEANDVFSVYSKAFADANNMTPLDITLVSLGALNGDCDWTVSKIEKLMSAPGADVAGYTNPVNANAAEVKITSAQTYVATTDSIVKAVENINENYVAITMKHTRDSSYYAMGINLMGKTENGWTAGLVLAMTKDGHYFRLGGVNNANMVQLNFYSMGNGAEYTVAYQLKYLETAGKVTHVQVTLWQGMANGALAKVAPHGDVTGGEGWTYNAELGSFLFNYNLFDEATQFAPDCTLIAMQAFNDKDVDCDWTVTKVEVSAEAPKPAASVINGMDQVVSVPANYDAYAQAVTNLSDQYVTIDFTKSSNDAFALGIHVLGTVDSCWLGDIMIRLANDGVYFNHGNVAGDHIAQIALFDLSNVTRFVYRITDVVVDGVAYKKVEMWAGTADSLTKLGNHSIFSGMEAFCSYDGDAQAYLFNVAAIQSVGYATTNDCSLQLPAALNAACAWTLKVSVSDTLPTA